MNNEPVAWMHTNSKQLFETTIPSKRYLHLFTPLYKQPMRELTDEEIIATFNYFCAFKDESESTIHNPKYFEEQMILYARLILETASRKASEK